MRTKSTLEINFKDEVRDLRIDFDLIDKIGDLVDWVELAKEFEKEDPCPPFTKMAKFIYYNLKEAGFSVTLQDRQEIYDEILIVEERGSYIQLVGELIAAYMPQGKKKVTEPVQRKKPTKKAL